MDQTFSEKKVTHERGRGEKRRRSLRTSTEASSGSLSPKGASSGSSSPEGPFHWTSTGSRSPKPIDNLDQSIHLAFASKSHKPAGLMPDRRSVSPQGASSGSSFAQSSPSPERSPSPAAFPATDSEHHQPSAKHDLSSNGQFATSVLANRPEPPDKASAPSGNNVKSTAGTPSSQPRSRYGIKISNFDLSVKTVQLERIVKLAFSHFGKLMSFAFHGKFNGRYCLLSYAHEQERNNALSTDGLKGPQQMNIRVEPWEKSEGPVFWDPNGFGIKIANIRLSKTQDIIFTIEEAFKKFGVIMSMQVVGDNEDRYVNLFYKHQYEQMAALSSKNRFSAQLGALKVSQLDDVPQHRDIKSVKFRKVKTGIKVKRHRMDPMPLSSANLWRDIGPHPAIPASNLFQVKDVVRQSDNTNLSPFSRSGPNTSQSSSTNLPNLLNHIRDRKAMGLPSFLGGVEHSRTTWSPNLNLPMNSQQICTNLVGPAIKGQTDFVKFQQRHEPGNALGSLKPLNLNEKTENVTVPKSYGTLVQSGTSASHHKASLTLWVNNLEDKTTKADLWTVFQPFGEIQHIEIREGFRNTGKQAFLQFLNLSSIYEAIQQMDGKYLGCEKLQLDFAYPNQPTNCVWVHGVCTTLNWSSLKNVYRQFGPVVELLHDSVKNTSLVLYTDVASAVKAVNEINARSVFGCQVSLGFANRRCQLGICHSMESSGQNVGGFYQLVGETSEWLIRKANIEKLLTLPS